MWTSTAVTLSVNNMAAEVIQAVGSEEQRNAYIPKICSGEYPAGGKLPSLVALQAESGLSAKTCQRAIAVLAAEGLVVTVPNRGTFVTNR